MIVKTFGRTGKAMEYVEFRIAGHKNAPRFVAQRSDLQGQDRSYSWWYVFEVHPGRNGQVVTLFADPEKEKAVERAELEAQRLAERLK